MLKDGMHPETIPLSLLRQQLPPIILGSIFSFVGLSAFAIAVIRDRKEFRVLLWFGLFIGMYGTRLLAQAASELALMPNSPWPQRLDAIVTYLLIVPGLLFWVDLSTGALRRFLQWLTLAGLAIGVVGLAYRVETGSPDKILVLNSLLAICMLIVLGVVVAVPRLSKKFLVIQSRVLAVCVPAIGAIALYVNTSHFLGLPTFDAVEPVAFVGWVFALGYIAAQRIFSNERRLFSIEAELETARQIQSSILPSRLPSLENLRIAAIYTPISAVAGDFYQFIQWDQHRLGVLVADVSGHGVPAALISSMIKVAMQSVADSAADPAQVLTSLNRILSPELRGQLISAAYLWIDTETRCARYSAAGHPPLLCWRHANGELHRVLSNGLLFGVAPESEYPSCSLRFEARDRLLIYTDGMTEPENASGESFGDRKLEQIVRDNREQPAAQLLQSMVSELQRWHAPSVQLLDDLTLIVIDVL